MIILHTEKIKRKSGFTLLETMIYLVILTAVFGFLFLTWQELSRFYARERATKEIHSAALFLSEYLSDAIRQAKSISEPGPGSQSSALRFGGSGCGGGVSIVWEAGDLFQEENGQKEKLNPDNIIIASLSFFNKGGNNFDSISADALLKYKNPTELAMLDKEFSLKFSSVNKQGWSCGSPVTFTYKGSCVTYGTVPRDYGGGNVKCWLDRNLGADSNTDPRVYTGYNDERGYGDLFQWGREDDLHQVRSPAPGKVEGNMTLTGQPGHANFILEQSSPYDWANNSWTTRWTVADDDPCPSGWRIPTDTELNTERLSWAPNNNYNGAFASPLKLTAGGARNYSNASLYDVGDDGRYWSSTVSATNARYLDFYSTGAGMYGVTRALGFSARCILD